MCERVAGRCGFPLVSTVRVLCAPGPVEEGAEERSGVSPLAERVRVPRAVVRVPPDGTVVCVVRLSGRPPLEEVSARIEDGCVRVRWRDGERSVLLVSP